MFATFSIRYFYHFYFCHFLTPISDTFFAFVFFSFQSKKPVQAPFFFSFNTFSAHLTVLSFSLPLFLSLSLTFFLSLSLSLCNIIEILLYSSYTLLAVIIYSFLFLPFSLSSFFSFFLFLFLLFSFLSFHSHFLLFFFLFFQYFLSDINTYFFSTLRFRFFSYLFSKLLFAPTLSLSLPLFLLNVTSFALSFSSSLPHTHAHIRTHILTCKQTEKYSYTFLFLFCLIKFFLSTNISLPCSRLCLLDSSLSLRLASSFFFFLLFITQRVLFYTLSFITFNFKLSCFSFRFPVSFNLWPRWLFKAISFHLYLSFFSYQTFPDFSHQLTFPYFHFHFPTIPLSPPPSLSLSPSLTQSIYLSISVFLSMYLFPLSASPIFPRHYRSATLIFVRFAPVGSVYVKRPDSPDILSLFHAGWIYCSEKKGKKKKKRK
ncbi:unnamed protein product [Acanthosepion pharaonis]|uniref:Uncharacterized protein n=1 Tax=Acanthosepion pharaonis TaxID=158019 RepID=A0A812BW00_ACAPH|nr:unnamed protein product [Sepia pharaonis]